MLFIVIVLSSVTCTASVAAAAEYNHEHFKEIVLNVKAMTHLAQFSIAFTKGKGHLYILSYLRKSFYIWLL